MSEKRTRRLLGAGWQPYSDVPSGEWLDWSGHVSFARDNLHLHLYWRVLMTKPEDALECERAFLAHLQEIEWNGTPLLTTSPEATLLHILHGGPEPGSLPWQADVLLTATSANELDQVSQTGAAVLAPCSRTARGVARMESIFGAIAPSGSPFAAAAKVAPVLE